MKRWLVGLGEKMTETKAFVLLSKGSKNLQKAINHRIFPTPAHASLFLECFAKKDIEAEIYEIQLVRKVEE